MRLPGSTVQDSPRFASRPMPVNGVGILPFGSADGRHILFHECQALRVAGVVEHRQPARLIGTARRADNRHRFLRGQRFQYQRGGNAPVARILADDQAAVPAFQHGQVE